jgi:flagellar basal-body rod modification protein FlgD
MIESTTSTTPSTDSQVVGSNRGDEQRSQFLRLLIAQIQGQDPLNPMDGTEFVAQLAQFTSVEELINIREVMERVEAALESHSAGPGEATDDSGTKGSHPFES